MRIRTVRLIGAMALLATTGLSAQARQTQPPAAGVLAHNLSVTIKYTGRGVIDATHPVLVFLFTSTPLNNNSQPVNMQMVTSNGGVAPFLNLPQEKVAIVAIYDSTGNYGGRGGPPPPGTAMGVYNPAPKATEPALVTVGPKTAVTLTFDGSQKFKGHE